MEPAWTRLRGKVVTDMSERAAMKRRVRGVLRHKWPEALAASVLALAPCAAAAALFALLVWPRVSGGQAVDLPSLGSMGGGVLDSLLMAAAMLGGGLSVNWRALGGAALWALIPLAVWALAALPMRVSVSGYYLALLRGKKTSALDVFSCFTERWPRYVGGMLLNALWLLLWAAMAVAAPVALYILAQPLLPKIQQALNLTVNTGNEKTAKAIGDSVYLMKHITCPGVLVECVFLSNSHEAQLLRQPEQQKRLAAAIVAGYLNFGNH